MKFDDNKNVETFLCPLIDVGNVATFPIRFKIESLILTSVDQLENLTGEELGEIFL